MAPGRVARGVALFFAPACSGESLYALGNLSGESLYALGNLLVAARAAAEGGHDCSSTGMSTGTKARFTHEF